MSEENKDLEEVVEEEVAEKPAKGKGKKKGKSKKAKKDIAFNKIIKDVLETVTSLFTDSPTRGMLVVQGVMGILLVAVFIGGFIGKLLGIVATAAGIIGVRALSDVLLGDDEEDAEEEESEEE